MQQQQEQQRQQLEQQQKLQQQQQRQRPPLLHQRPVSSESRKSGGSTGRRSANQNQLQPPKTPPTKTSPRGASPDRRQEVPSAQPPHDQTTPVQKLVEISDTVDHIPHPPSSTLPPHRPKKALKPINPRPTAKSAPATEERHYPQGVPEDFFERLQYFEDESNKHKKELYENISKSIREDLEKKLAGQHKLSRQEAEMYDALKDVSLPALFMPFKTGTIFNPRAHQYFHPTGSTDFRLSQPPSMFQLPPLPTKSRMSVVNLFELSRNFSNRGQAWLMEKYIQQQEPVANTHGVVPHTPVPTVTNASRGNSGTQQREKSSVMNSNQSQIHSLRDPRELDMDLEME